MWPTPPPRIRSQHKRGKNARIFRAYEGKLRLLQTNRKYPRLDVDNINANFCPWKNTRCGYTSNEAYTPTPGGTRAESSVEHVRFIPNDGEREGSDGNVEGWRADPVDVLHLKISLLNDFSRKTRPEQD